MLKENVKRKRAPYTKFALFLKENNISQARLAKMLGKGTSTVNQNINGTGSDFTVAEVYALCKALGISADEYFFHEKVSIMKTFA